MWKRLAVIAVFSALLLAWPSVAENQKGGAHTASSTANQAKGPIPPTHVVIDPPLPPSNASQPPPNTEQGGSTERPLPRFERPEWVIVYVTVIYAFIAWFTLLAIKRQADTMERQANDAREAAKEATAIALDTAKAAKDSAKAAQATVEAMKEQIRDSHQKERARIVVKIVPDKLPITQILWQVKFQVRNIGPTRAFDVWLNVEFEFTSSPVPPRIPQPKMLDRVPRIRPEKWRHVNSGPFFWGDDERGSNQARMQEVADGKLFLHLRGTVDYQDIFGDSHVIPFRYMWNAERARWFKAVHSEDPKAT